MSRPPHPRAVVAAASLDLRRAPDHASEMRSQLLLGEVVRVLGVSPDRRWWRIENRADRYRGWVRTWGLVGAATTRTEAWLRKARARIAEPMVEVRSSPGARAGLLVGPLLWNSRVIPGARRGRWRRVEMPDGRRGWVEAATLDVGRRRIPGIAERVESLLGVPYLWGGRTAAAFDCSGFVQQVFAEQGTALPRDAHQQFRSSRALRRGVEPRLGDLVFFAPPGERSAHVGLVLGGGYFAHARGWVRIGSMENHNPLHDKELAIQFTGFRRVSGAPIGGLRRPPPGGKSA